MIFFISVCGEQDLFDLSVVFVEKLTFTKYVVIDINNLLSTPDYSKRLFYCHQLCNNQQSTLTLYYVDSFSPNKIS